MLTIYYIHQLLTFSVCPMGYTTEDGGMTCVECGIGKFKNTTSNDACALCDMTQSTVHRNSTNETDCRKLSISLSDHSE